MYEEDSFFFEVFLGEAVDGSRGFIYSYNVVEEEVFAG